MNLALTELYDYDTLRSEREATMYVVRAERATLVLGSAQSIDILDAQQVERRRFGGVAAVAVSSSCNLTTSGSTGGFPPTIRDGAVTSTPVHGWSVSGGPAY